MHNFLNSFLYKCFMSFYIYFAYNIKPEKRCFVIDIRAPLELQCKVFFLQYTVMNIYEVLIYKELI